MTFQLTIGAGFRKPSAPPWSVTRQASSIKFAELVPGGPEQSPSLQEVASPPDRVWIEPLLGILRMRPRCLQSGFWDGTAGKPGPNERRLVAVSAAAPDASKSGRKFRLAECSR